MRGGRTEAEIFADLKLLCTSPGYIHALAYICCRDGYTKYAVDEDDEDGPVQRPSSTALITTEISALLVLLIQKEIDSTFPDEVVLREYVERTEALMEEMHQALSPRIEQMLEANGEDGISGAASMSFGKFMREPIFYGGESVYPFQYRDIAPEKYQKDEAWLLEKKGFTVADARKVFLAINDLQSPNVLGAINYLHANPGVIPELLGAFVLELEEVAKVAGLDKAVTSAVVSAFAVNDPDLDVGYTAFGDFNAAQSYPILKIDADTFVCLQPSNLYAALYEAPFYWMAADRPYCQIAMKHRGQFTEDFCAKALGNVFGRRAVFSNVLIQRSAKIRDGEIDVLVVYGNRLIVVQTKSKRLSLTARKGNEEAVREDFRKAVVDNYSQGLQCAKLLGSKSHRTVLADGTVVPIPDDVREIYIMCVVSDSYPALSFQAREFLKVEQTDVIQQPLVIDIFALDVLAEMLDSPLQFLSYLNRRANFQEKLMADQELTIFALHLRQNLWVSGELDMVFLAPDIASELDHAMTVRRDGIEGNKIPEGTLTRNIGTAVGVLIRQLEREANGAAIDVGLFLLTLSDKALGELEEKIKRLLSSARSGKKQSSFSGLMGEVGIALQCNDEDEKLRGIWLVNQCIVRKYTTKRDRWYGISLDSAARVRCAVSHHYEWQQDDEMERMVTEMGARNTLWEKG